MNDLYLRQLSDLAREDLNDWESEFVNSLQARLDDDGQLTSRQAEKLHELHARKC